MTTGQFNKELSSFLEKYGVKQEEIARISGLTQVSISNLVTGKTVARNETMYKLRKAMEQIQAERQGA